ncbi:MAG: hypothetical protein ABIA93_06260 [Candidatus Woesearchaeota archaeon]
MSHPENKVDWCLKKAKMEMQESGIHRGLVKREPNRSLALLHIAKAEHNMRAMASFKRTGFSDWSASAAFYSIYHALLAKEGYESRNQECTFAAVYQLISIGRLDIDARLIRKVSSMNLEEAHEYVDVVSLREMEQYGVSLSLDEDKYTLLRNLATEILETAKTLIEK